jgi:hypothetical protein
MLLVILPLAACTPRYPVDADIPIELDTRLEAAELAELERARQAMDQYWIRVCQPLLRPGASPYDLGWNEAIRRLKPITDGTICRLYAFDTGERARYDQGAAEAIAKIGEVDDAFIGATRRFDSVEARILESSAYRLGTGERSGATEGGKDHARGEGRP